MLLRSLQTNKYLWIFAQNEYTAIAPMFEMKGHLAVSVQFFLYIYSLRWPFLLSNVHVSVCYFMLTSFGPRILNRSFCNCITIVNIRWILKETLLFFFALFFYKSYKQILRTRIIFSSFSYWHHCNNSLLKTIVIAIIFRHRNVIFIFIALKPSACNATS